jgi:hypothetical protein
MEGKRYLLATAFVLCTVVITCCAPAATPTPPAADEVPEGIVAARESALSYVLKTYGEQVFPAPGSNWTAQRTTPEGLVGSESWEFTAVDVTVSVSCPVVAPQNVVCRVTVDKGSGFSWQGSVDAAGQVTE